MHFDRISEISAQPCIFYLIIVLYFYSYFSLYFLTTLKATIFKQSVTKNNDIPKAKAACVFGSPKAWSPIRITTIWAVIVEKLSLNSLSKGITLPFKKNDFVLETDQIDKLKIQSKLGDNQKSLQKEKLVIDKNLSNSNFVERAPKELIEQNQKRQVSINLELSKIESILKNL